MTKNTIAVAELETARFSFRAYGRTEEEALAVMRKTWLKHKRVTKAEYTWDDLVDDVNVQLVRIGAGYRDWLEMLYKAEK